MYVSLYVCMCECRHGTVYDVCFYVKCRDKSMSICIYMHTYIYVFIDAYVHAYIYIDESIEVCMVSDIHESVCVCMYVK